MSFSVLSSKYQFWEKETSAFTLQLPSALQVSASELFFQYDLVIFGIEEGEVPEYTLEDLLEPPEQAPSRNHQKVYSAIKQWVAPSLCHGESIVIDIAVTDTKRTPPLDTSTNKRSGVQIVTNNHHLLVQVEVESGNKKEATLRKHTWFAGSASLAEEPSNDNLQLKWFLFYEQVIRPCDLRGFGVGGRFVEICANPAQAAQRVCKGQHRAGLDYCQKNTEVCTTVDQPPTNHVVPLSSYFLQSKFGAGAVQMTAGQSLVIASPQSGKIFKYCFSGYERTNIMELLLRGNKAGPRRSVFPTESLRVDREHLFSLSAKCLHRKCTVRHNTTSEPIIL